MAELPTARSYAGVHTVHAVCPQCDRLKELDLAAIVEGGQGDFPLIHLPLRYSACGQTGHQSKSAATLTGWAAKVRTGDLGSARGKQPTGKGRVRWVRLSRGGNPTHIDDRLEPQKRNQCRLRNRPRTSALRRHWPAGRRAVTVDVGHWLAPGGWV